MTEAAPESSPERGPDIAEAYPLYLERRDWQAALAAWEAVEAAGGASVAARLAMAHCRIELADAAALPGILVGALPAVPGDRRDDVVALVRRRAYECLLAAEPVRAAQLTRLLAAVDPHLQHVYATAILPESAPRPLPAPPTAPPPLPFEEDAVPDDALAATLARHRDRRVLLLLRRHPASGHATLIDAIAQYLQASLDALGLAHLSLDSHPTADDSAAVAGRLRDTVAAFKPDVIVIDDLLVSGASSDPGHAEAIATALAAARAGGAKIVAHYPDGWHAAIPPVINHIADRVDLIHMPSGAQLSRLSAAAFGKTLYFPYPHVPALPAAANPVDLNPVDLKPRACVAGRINWANEARLAWWNEIARRGLPVDIHPTVFGHERSPADYAALTGSYAININLTMRTSGVRIATGRTFETPLVGSLLLEEANEDAAYFMRPHDHFVPFSTLRELEVRLDELLADAPRRQRIARAGQDWARRHFTGRQFWAQLLRRLFES